MSHNHTRLKSLVFKLLAIALAVAILAVVDALAGVTFAHDHPGSSLALQADGRLVGDPYREFRNNPRYVRRYDGIAYRYNAQGFREEADVPAKGPREFRVFVLGGSTAYGERASEQGQYQLISGQRTYASDQTISAHLQRELAAAMPDRDVHVYNAAVVNYRIVHCYETYLETLRPLQPDLVISIDGQNENYTRENPFFATGFVDVQSSPLVHALRSHSYLLYDLSVFFRQSRLFDRLNGRNRQEIDDAALDAMPIANVRAQFADDAAHAPVPEPVLQGLMRVYSAFQSAALADGVPTLFAIQPVITLDQTKTMTAIENRLLKYNATRHYLKGPIRRLAERLSQRRERDPDFHYVDLQDTFADFSGEAYTDYCHLTPAANAHVAKRLAAIIMNTASLHSGSGAVSH